MGAHPIGAPGCPEFAASGWSAETARMVLTHFNSMAGPLYCGGSVDMFSFFALLLLSVLVCFRCFLTG